MTTATKPRKSKKRSSDPEQLQQLVDHYEDVFGEVARFINLIKQQEEEIGDAQRVFFEAKEKFERTKSDLASARDARDGTKHALFMFLKPGPAEILPLFDRMEPADEEKHGTNAEEWRKEPVSALRLSMNATNLLTAADIILVGQLQDRVQTNPTDWWQTIEALTEPMALAICDRLNDFIAEKTGE